MTDVPEWVLAAAKSAGAKRMLAAPHWLAWAEHADPRLHAAALATAERFAITGMDDSGAPEALSLLLSRGNLGELLRSQQDAIPSNMLEAGLSLQDAEIPITATGLACIFPLLGRIWDATGWEGNRLGRLYEWKEDLACEVLWPEVTKAALDPERGWERIADLYDAGVRTPERMLAALDAPLPLADGAL